MIPYQHEPFTDFTKEENREAYFRALEKVESELGKEYPLIIGGERVFTEEKHEFTTLLIVKKQSVTCLKRHKRMQRKR